jgi:biopolymer transport protein ExbB
MVTAASNQRLTLYLDGLEMFYANIDGSLPDFSGDYIVGAAADGSHGCLCDLDEVRLSTIVRPMAWARTAFAGQGPDGMLYSLGEEQAGGGGGLPVFYLATIMKNITLDGWVIIGLLIVLMMVSWIVFLNKTFFLVIAGKENKSFSALFRRMDDPIASFDPDNGFDNSSLYRVYAGGCRTVREINASGGSTNPESILKVLKTALEEGFVKETQRLNSRILVLTLAITGGPFLGLLGTVWGVMNTFAALAEAGEANIMAIAPGVASALSTTVFGLIVAIPALFAYNYLVAKIKIITADLTVFIDQFTLKMDR